MNCFVVFRSILHSKRIFDRCIVSLYSAESRAIRENVEKNHKQVVNVAKRLQDWARLLQDHNQHPMDLLLVAMYETN